MALDTMPALYDVTGVASDDVLNIRQSPAASSDLVGSLAPNAIGVEVIRLSDTGSWGLVNTQEWAGWVSMRFMARHPDQGLFPMPATCFGTEPFWSMTLPKAGPVAFKSAAGENYSFQTKTTMTANGMPYRYSVVADGSDGTMHSVISRSACNDGMSDMEFGLTIDVILRAAAGYTHYSGCCSLTR
ncbi:peptide-binding protein [Aliiroseovarius subalbicans]|uniref:COG3650 family protein n=1 Tax=Aliiroseovarius subalbicans TaxID=2925840 RepID=UPI001F58F63A|nr:peptide-binding protein [Aliiroseovarius subalbicans]MCI2400107.1 peptide-binding protein [Aliiroseovarius subalbicans]